jgi:pimeloyl-ACP methyl ester carboxylesterase
MPRAAIGDLTVHYQQAGKGPDLTLIHGLCANLAFWYLTVVPKLAESFRVTVYDLRGHGLTQRLPRGYRAIDLATDLGRLLDHLGIASAHLVGHSFGGAVALAFAIQQPQRVRTLTLADAWIPTLQPAPLARSRPRWRRLQSELRQSGFVVDRELPAAVHDFLEEVIRLRDRDGAAPPNDGFRALGTMLNRDGGDSMALRRWGQLVRMTSAVKEFPDGTGLSRVEIGRFQRPASIMFGNHSRYLPTMQGLEATLADCRSTIIPNAGHYFPVLNPDIFTREVGDFAGQHDGA